VILLEFAAQGVRGVAPAGGRATLRPGYNVVAADGAALRKLLEALLHPGPRDAEGMPRAPGAQPGAAPLKAGLTLVGDDRVTYRLVRDFAAGCQLHRFDAEKRAFALVAQELPAIAEFLRKTAGAPPEGRFRTFLTLAAADLPSRQGARTSITGSEQPVRASLAPDEARKRLGQLKGELERARVAEKLQYQLDGLQARLFKLDEAMKGGARIDEGLEKAEAARRELGEVAHAAEGLGEPEAKLAAYEKLAARREEALAKAAKEREGLDAAEASGGPVPFWRDGRFWGATGGGLLLAAIATVGAASQSDLRYLSIPAIGAFGGGGWLAFRWIGELEGWERIARRRRVIDDWERKVTDQFERDGAEVHAAMKALGLTRPGELKEALGRLADADQVVSEWRRRKAEWEGSPEATEAKKERSTLEGQVRELEGQLASEAGGFVRDVRSVESEIQRMEVDAAAPPAAAAPPPPPPAAAAATADPLRALLEKAGAELGQSPAAAARTVAAKASAHLSGLSFQRLSTIQPDDRGNLAVVTGGRPAPAASLSGADRDLVFLAMKLAFLEKALAETRSIALVDDVFAGLAEGSRRFAARLLKQLAKPGQIVHATTDPAFKEAADHVA